MGAGRPAALFAWDCFLETSGYRDACVLTLDALRRDCLADLIADKIGTAALAAALLVRRGRCWSSPASTLLSGGKPGGQAQQWNDA